MFTFFCLPWNVLQNLGEASSLINCYYLCHWHRLSEFYYRTQPTFGVELRSAAVQPTLGVELRCAAVQPALGVELKCAAVQPTLGVELRCAVVQPTFGVELRCAAVQPTLGVELRSLSDWCTIHTNHNYCKSKSWTYLNCDLRPTQVSFQLLTN